MDVGLFAGASPAGQIAGDVNFNAQLFAGESMARFVSRLGVMAASLPARDAALQAVLVDAKAKVWALPLMPANEDERVLWRFNDDAASFPTNLCVHDLIVAQAARTPDRVAIEWQGNKMLHSEQLRCASLLGMRLRACA